ncbi:MAG: metallophosphatase family protein [Desulfuromonadales bacterium]|jgi:putative phosphoesterase|nr:metallophosphatase family protein [Desulfuromonadales bacterium]
MTVKIGLISDIHAVSAPLQEALAIFAREGVETILCAGDVAGYGSELEQAVALLSDSQCQVILGNHDLWRLEDCSDEPDGPAEKFLRCLPRVAELCVEGKSLYMVHGSPPQSIMEGVRLLDEKAALISAQKEFWDDYLRSFPFDVLVVGHTHQVFVERLGDVLVVNPGSTLFNHSCAILSLPEMVVEILPLGGKPTVLSWNWGLIGDAFKLDAGPETS